MATPPCSRSIKGPGGGGCRFLAGTEIDAANQCDRRRRERSRLFAAALFSGNVSAGRWSLVRSRALMRLFRTISNHTLSGRRPRVAFIVAPPWRADRSCGHAGLGAVGGGDGDRAPIDRRPSLRVWERRLAGHARGAPPRIESSKDSDSLIDGASYRADRAPMNRWAGLSHRSARG
jgi:hypothetical protein